MLGNAGYSSLSEPEIVMLDGIQVVINGVTYDVVDLQLINRDDFILKTAFTVPIDAMLAMQAHSETGVIATTPGGDVFFGFNGSVRDEKILELAASCLSSQRGTAGTTRHDPLQRHRYSRR